MINAVIVDDEPKAIQSLSWELTNFSNEISIIATFTSPENALEFLKHNTPDCLFLDIQMPTMDGFQFIQKLIVGQPFQNKFLMFHQIYICTPWIAVQNRCLIATLLIDW